MAKERTIILKSYDNNRIALEHDDSTNDIVPGMAVVETSLRKCKRIQAKQSKLDNYVTTMIVTENNLAGLEISGAYKEGYDIDVWLPGPGDIGLVKLDNATKQSLSFGDALSPTTNGGFRKAAGETKSTNISAIGDRPVCRVLEAVADDGLGTKDADSWVKVRFL